MVTDVGSTKQSVLADVAAVCGSLPPWFVAGHPIAGTEKSGVAHSSAELFQGHRVILTPHAGQDACGTQDYFARLWRSTGARVVEMDAAAARRHFCGDVATCRTCWPTASSTCWRALDTDDEIFANAGGGFRDFTRIASSSPADVARHRARQSQRR